MAPQVKLRPWGDHWVYVLFAVWCPVRCAMHGWTEDASVTVISDATTKDPGFYMTFNKLYEMVS